MNSFVPVMARRHITSAALLASLFLATMIGLGGLAYWNQWQTELSRTSGMARSLSIAAAEQIGGSLRTIDLLIQHVGQYVMENGELNAPAVAAAMNIQSRSFPEMASLVVADERGLAHNERAQRVVDVSRRDYFLLQRLMYRDNRVVVDGPLRDAESGEWQVVLSRPLVDSRGRFRGVVAAVLKPSFFADPLVSTGMSDAAAAVTLFNVNGVVFGRFPNGEKWIGGSLPVGRLPISLGEDEGRGTFRTQGAVDGIDEMAAWRQIPHYPLTVLAAIPVAAVRAAWWRETMRSAAIAGLIGLVMIYLGSLFDREERRRQRAAEDLDRLNRDLEQRVAERTQSLSLEIAERSRAEAHAERLREAYQELFDGAIEGILIHRDFKPLLANHSCARLFGFQRVDELLAVPSILDLIKPDWRPTISRVTRDTLDGRGPETLEFEGIRRDGGPLWCRNSVRRVHWDGGSAIQAAFINITASKDWQGQLAAAKEAAEKASELKSRFLAVASHDLRQPVQALAFYVNVLAKRLRGTASSETESILGRIGESTESLSAHLDSLLDMSKLEAGMVRPQQRNLALAPMLERLWAFYCPAAEQAGISLTVVPADCQVQSDPVLLERVLQNLLTNAIRYTPAGGKILVGCRRRGAKRALQVIDNGPGIPEDMQRRIFDEFFRLNGSSEGGRGGLGLGLSIVRRLCEMLGHQVAVRSHPGCGAMFEVLVEAGQEAAAAPCAPAAPPAVELAPGSRVLVVDDDPRLRESLKLQLEDWGLVVHLARSAEEAVAQMRTGEHLDLVLADYRLEAGETGIGIIERLRQGLGRPLLPSILLTAETNPPCRSIGIRLLHKPVTPEVLRQVLAEILNERVSRE